LILIIDAWELHHVDKLLPSKIILR
jgi:hypothetical protein